MAGNSVDRKGGLVVEAERESFFGQATEALLSARDMENNQSIVTRVFRHDEVVGIGGVAGDLYLIVPLN